MDQTPNESTSDQPKFNHRRLTHIVAAVAGGAVVALYFTKYRTTLVCCNVSPEMVARVKENHELLWFGDARNKAVVSLTRNV